VTEPTLSAQLREQVRGNLKSPAHVREAEKLMMRAAFCLDELEKQLIAADAELANVTFGEAAGQRERIIAQAECERCATICEEQNKFTPWQDKEHYKMAAQCAYAIRALAPRAAKDPEATQEGDQFKEAHSLTRGMPAPASGPDRPDFAPGLALTAGGVCAKCGFTYWEHRGHLIACPVCENERLRAVADAAKAWLPYCYAGTESSVQSVLDNFVAAVRALE
jgi:hypothetical protein